MASGSRREVCTGLENERHGLGLTPALPLRPPPAPIWPWKQRLGVKFRHECRWLVDSHCPQTWGIVLEFTY